MNRDCPITQNLKARQEAFFLAAERRGFDVRTLAQATGIPAETLSSYRTRPSREASAMPLTAFIKLGRVTGLTDLLSELIRDSEHCLAPVEAPETGWDIVAAGTAELVAEICVARADGKIDHVERARLREKAGPVIAIIQGAIAES